MQKIISFTNSGAQRLHLKKSFNSSFFLQGIYTLLKQDFISLKDQILLKSKQNVVTFIIL